MSKPLPATLSDATAAFINANRWFMRGTPEFNAAWNHAAMLEHVEILRDIEDRILPKRFMESEAYFDRIIDALLFFSPITGGRRCFVRPHQYKFSVEWYGAYRKAYAAIELDGAIIAASKQPLMQEIFERG